jgi:hypothetical protein
MIMGEKEKFQSFETQKNIKTFQKNLLKIQIKVIHENEKASEKIENEGKMDSAQINVYVVLPEN